tara:strand:- start:3543 stop:3722 length:180 start_codon:yes stop_codon:yes gene_type:complete
MPGARLFKAALWLPSLPAITPRGRPYCLHSLLKSVSLRAFAPRLNKNIKDVTIAVDRAP